MSSGILHPAILSRIQDLALRSRRLADSMLVGAHRHPRYGTSIEFAEHRPYEWGDDLRRVDWKAFGRTDRFYVRQFEDERRLIVRLVVDASGSMAYRGEAAAWSKWEAARTLAAALAWLATRQGDAVGLDVLAAEPPVQLPVSLDRQQLARVIDRLENASAEPGRSASLPTGPSTLVRIRSLVVWISDLMENLEAVQKHWQMLRHAGHDILLLHVLDRDELTMPFEKATRFVCLETGRAIATEPRLIRHAYRRAVERFLARLESACRRGGIDYERFTTDEPLGRTLQAFLARRQASVTW